MAGAEAMVLRRLPRAAELVGPVPRERCPRLIFWHTPGTLAASKWHKMPRRDTRKPLSCKVLGGAAWGRSSALNLLVVGSPVPAGGRGRYLAPTSLYRGGFFSSSDFHKAALRDCFMLVCRKCHVVTQVETLIPAF